MLDFSEAIGLQPESKILNWKWQIFRRALDLVGSFLGLLLLSPLIGLLALLIKLSSPGQVVYRQIRVGRFGRPLPMLKFRTMYLDAELQLQGLLEDDQNLKEEWENHQKLKEDPRITPIGKILRRFSLDELPQLYNVFIGDMSLIGPRPIMFDQIGLYGDSYEYYVLLRPGMTGLWQVSGRARTTFQKRAQLDIEYFQQWSFWLDVYILLKTFKVVFWQQGAY